MAEFEIAVDDHDAGDRVDIVLVRRVPNLSRDRAKALFESGEVRLNGKRIKKSHRVAAGDRLTLENVPTPNDFEAEPDDKVELRVVLETRAFVIVDKPVGIPSHPLREGELGSVANVLVARYPEMRGVGYRGREPGIVHRLDNDTSGLMLAARHTDAFEALLGLLRSGSIEKHYRATCIGSVEAPQTITTPIAADPQVRRKVRACRDPREAERLGAQPSTTAILESEPDPEGSRVEVRADRARRHQIRVHLSSIGHPLLGDVLYGAPAHASGHHHLEATRLRFTLDGREYDVTR